MSRFEAESLDIVQTNWLRKIVSHPVDHLSFLMEDKTSLGIVGDRGSGKSELGKALCGLSKFTGDIFLNGRKIRYPFNKKTYGEIQAVFSTPAAVFDAFRSIRQTTLDFLRGRGYSKTEAERAAAAAFSRVGLPAAAQESLIAELDDPLAMRAALARAISAGPEILICDDILRTPDDPLGGVLQAVMEETSLQLLFLSSYPARTLALCGRILILHEGKLAESISGADAVPRHPYARMLFELEKQAAEGG